MRCTYPIIYRSHEWITRRRLTLLRIPLLLRTLLGRGSRVGFTTLPGELMTLATASVHGRFQPFHNEHLEYVLAAKAKCDFLWIGITKYDTTPSEFTPLGRPRERPENNPLTYFERISIVSESLIEAGLQA